MIPDAWLLLLAGGALLFVALARPRVRFTASKKASVAVHNVQERG